MPKSTTLAIKSRASQVFAKIKHQLWRFTSTRPLLAFFGLLFIILILIVAGNFFRQPPVVTNPPVAEPKSVEIYTFKDSPKITLTAQVEKAGVMNVVAQMPGIVQVVNFSEGETVRRGSTLVALSTNYQGGNATTLARMMAEKNFTAASQNFDLQKDLIVKQRDLANQGQLAAEEMRSISRQSIDETKSAIALSEDIVSTLNQNIEHLVATNLGGANDAAILGAKQGKAAALSGLNQMKGALRGVEYQSNEDKSPAQMSDLSRELTVKQLELQERSLTLAKDLAGLNLKLARVSEAMMFPASPFAGKVEKIHVRPGQNVNPGTILATIRADHGANTATILTSAEIARSIVATEPSIFQIGSQAVELLPEFISDEATDGSLHTIIYSLPDQYDGWLTNHSSLAVSVPIGPQKIVVNDPLVPLDAVYQTQDQAYVYVAVPDGNVYKVVTKEVELAEVAGQYVSVIGGLGIEDILIVSRTVSAGEAVTIK